MTTKPSRRRTILKNLVFAAFTLGVIYLVVSVYLATLLAHPTRRPLTSTPTQYGLEYQDVQFTSAGDNISLKGWFIDSPGDATILVLHGSNSIRDNYISMEISRVLVQNGYDILLFDFRGHGESGGDLYSLGTWETRDVAGALAYLRTRGVTEVGVLAHSMGAATAILAAPDHPEMRAIVADSAFSDLFTILERERTRMGVPSLFNPGILFASKLMYGLDPLTNEPKRAIARLSDRPILLIHSTVDNLIPPTEAYELQKAGATNPNLELWMAPGNAHVSAFAVNKEEYLKRVTGFFDKHLKGN